VASQALSFAEYLSLSFALGATANALSHAVVNVAFGNFARYHFARKVSASLRLLAQLTKVRIPP
jgi:hypothetical protein